MHLFSRFHAYYRWTAGDCLKVLESSGFEIAGQELIPEKIPLLYVMVRKPILR